MMLNEIQVDFILKVAELPFRGTNTIIQILADDTPIYSFLSKPEDDYLEESLRATLQSIFSYQEQKNTTDTGFIY